jgi:hypothetical protein
VSTRKIVLDPEHPRRSTEDMATWFTTKPCALTVRSHINVCVFDSTWESTEAFALDHSPEVGAWVKNDHLGFEVHYLLQGAVRKYRPDFLIRLRNGLHLVLEVKGRATDQDKAKREALGEWVEAVNEHGGFGRWACEVSFGPSDLRTILAKHAADAPARASAGSAVRSPSRRSWDADGTPQRLGADHAMRPSHTRRSIAAVAAPSRHRPRPRRVPTVRTLRR